MSNSSFQTTKSSQISHLVSRRLACFLHNCCEDVTLRRRIVTFLKERLFVLRSRRNSRMMILLWQLYVIFAFERALFYQVRRAPYCFGFYFLVIVILEIWHTYEAKQKWALNSFRNKKCNLQITSEAPFFISNKSRLCELSAKKRFMSLIEIKRSRSFPKRVVLLSLGANVFLKVTLMSLTPRWMQITSHQNKCLCRNVPFELE